MITQGTDRYQWNYNTSNKMSFKTAQNFYNRDSKMTVKI